MIYVIMKVADDEGWETIRTFKESTKEATFNKVRDYLKFMCILLSSSGLEGVSKNGTKFMTSETDPNSIVLIGA